MITREELVACSIQNWYAAFAKHTFKTVILPLPADVITWLGEDGVVLPNTSAAVSLRKYFRIFAPHNELIQAS